MCVQKNGNFLPFFKTDNIIKTDSHFVRYEMGDSMIRISNPYYLPYSRYTIFKNSGFYRGLTSPYWPLKG